MLVLIENSSTKFRGSKLCGENPILKHSFMIDFYNKIKSTAMSTSSSYVEIIIQAISRLSTTFPTKIPIYQTKCVFVAAVGSMITSGAALATRDKKVCFAQEDVSAKTFDLCFKLLQSIYSTTTLLLSVSEKDDTNKELLKLAAELCSSELIRSITIIVQCMPKNMFWYSSITSGLDFLTVCTDNDFINIQF